jgi:hypothetical protein
MRAPSTVAARQINDPTPQKKGLTGPENLRRPVVPTLGLSSLAKLLEFITALERITDTYRQIWKCVDQDRCNSDKRVWKGKVAPSKSVQLAFGAVDVSLG